MNGSVITPMNCVIALKVVCWLPTAVSPDNCVSALLSAGPVKPNTPTKAGGRFEVLFRFYGPEKPLFDKTWKLGDIMEVK